MNDPIKPLVVLAIAAMALSACQSLDTNRYDAVIAAEVAQMPTEWQQISEPAITPQDWQSLFKDPLLRQYLARAEASNLDLKQAEARLRQSEASLRQSRSLLGPSISADLSASGFTDLSDLGETGDSGSASIAASFNPDLFGINRTRVEQAEAQFDVQRATTERLRRVILAQTARAYFQIIEADQQLRLARENLTFLEETKRVSQARFEAGDIARSDLALAELEFENAVAGLRNQEFAARSARRSLSVLLGDFGADDLDVADRLPAPAMIATLPVPADLVSARADVVAARATLAVTLAELDVARKANWPSLRLTGRIGSSGADLGDLFDPDFYIASLGAGLSSVLFDSGRNRAQVEGAKAGIDAALAAYADVLRTAVFEVNDAFDQVGALTEALEALERASASAEEALELEQIKFDLGETILLDVLTVQRRVNAIQSARINTERRLLEAQVNAYLALGRVE